MVWCAVLRTIYESLIRTLRVFVSNDKDLSAAVVNNSSESCP